MENENGCTAEPAQCDTPNTPGNLRAYGTVAPAPRHQEVMISKVANGFVLRIGCSTFVAKNWEEASTGIAEYWKDPIAAQKKYTN